MKPLKVQTSHFTNLYGPVEDYVIRIKSRKVWSWSKNESVFARK